MTPDASWQPPQESDCSTIRLRSWQLRRSTPQTRQEKPDSEPWLIALHAAESKKAADIRILDLRPVTSFTEYFVICSGSNPRQIQAICDEVTRQLKSSGRLPLNVEGYANADWVLADYGDFIVHVFSEHARQFYDLERLWRQAKPVEVPAD